MGPLVAELIQSHEPSPPAHRMQCMEVWGGSHGTDRLVSVPGLDAWVYSRPYADDADGGDIHYLSMCGWGMLARFLVADVSGHGGAVASLAGSLRDLMRQNVNTLDQSDMMRSLNERFADVADDGRFATAVAASYYAPIGKLIVSNAGHPHPLWYQAKTGRWRWLRDDCDGQSRDVADLPLGLIAGTAYRQFAVPMSRGDAVVIYSDGMVEAMNGSRQQLGMSRLLALAESLDATDPRRFGTALLEYVTEHRGDVAWDDDVTLVVLRHNGHVPSSEGGS